jgi:hypothetical protein
VEWLRDVFVLWLSAFRVRCVQGTTRGDVAF